MKYFKQASWDESLIFELSCQNKIGWLAPKLSKDEDHIFKGAVSQLPKQLIRDNPPNLPEVSEVEVVRHFLKLTQSTYGVDLGIYPLGSCTMKYTPKFTNQVVRFDQIRWIHPYEDTRLTQGLLRILYELSQFLEEITGMYKFTLQPSAGAQGELTGAFLIRAYHKDRGELSSRNEMIIPDTAHGTNPASASMAGFKVITIPSNKEGTVDIEALKYTIGKKTAGLMMTNPNTLGLFEKNIIEIAEIVHEAGGLLYYDGANLNAILGKTRPGDMGFDIAHINLHKTFSAPHGGGGPGSGPVGVSKELKAFLPVPTIEFDNEKYYLDYVKEHSIGRMHSFYGNITVLIRAYMYILSLGGTGLKRVSELAVLHSNYLLNKLKNIRGYTLPFNSNPYRKHEFVISAEIMKKETGVTAQNIAKRLLDKGIHPPTIYFPLTVKEALMIEPTETESIEELDKLANALIEISAEAYSDTKVLIDAPRNTSVDKVDEVAASHPKTMSLTWKMMSKT